MSESGIFIMTEGNTLDFHHAFCCTQDKVENFLRKAPLAVRDYTSHLARARGKYIRAAALLTCAMDREDRIHAEAAELGAAVELLHLATLVHDDVMDDAHIRRGMETLQKKFGKRTAVICGDYLLAAALKMAAPIKDRKEFNQNAFPDYVGKICMGELQQHKNNRNFDLGLYRYLSIIKGKTAVLFQASFYGGALFCEKEEKALRDYRRLGYFTGMIFQLMDDCIDYEADEMAAKKNVSSDYEQGVVTLPLIYTLSQQKELKEEARKGRLSLEEVNQKVKNSGGLTFTRMVAGRYYHKAQYVLEELGLTGIKREKLLELLDKAYYGLENTKETPVKMQDSENLL